jgi:hypothetical protein
MNKTVKIILALVILGGAIGAFVGYKMYNKPHRDISEEEPDFSYTADELYNDYSSNEEEANAKYLDKVIQVSGEVDMVEINQGGDINITLSAEEAMMGGVSATVDSRFKAQAEEISIGDEITLKCRCTGMLMDVVLVDCSIIE